jgi:hypothetical protein
MVNKNVLFDAVTKHQPCVYCDEFLQYKASPEYEPIFSNALMRDWNQDYVKLVTQYFDIDEKYGDGTTLLYNCVQRKLNRFSDGRIIKPLLEAGASVCITSKSGVSLLDLAQTDREMYELLLLYDVPIKEPE